MKMEGKRPGFYLGARVGAGASRAETKPRPFAEARLPLRKAFWRQEVCVLTSRISPDCRLQLGSMLLSDL